MTGTQRIVSVLFADVVSSTAIGAQLGPERSKFLFDEIVALIVQEVRRFDGTVAQLAGDGVFALFGAPVGHEDDAERAVRAALAIQAAIAAYGEELRSGYGIDLAVRVSVNTGPVVLSEDDGEARYNALGDTANIAARLQELAPGGGIVVGPETERQVQYCFELEALGEVDLRGLEGAVRAARVTGARGPAHVRAVVPVVGRVAELAVLDEACQAIADGSGAIVAVTGESGIGKSRLVIEARRRFGDRIRFLEGRAGSYAETFPYWPVRDLLRDWLGIGVDAPEARVRLELKAALGALAPGTDAAYPLLARLLGLPLEAEADGALRELSREAVQQRTFAAVGDVMRALAAAQPLCIVMDDLQWADSLTLELVEDLLALTEEAQIGFVLLYRADRDQPSWRLGEHARAVFPHRYREIELRPLPPAASRELAEALAEAALPGELADLLAERAGGNPFFLEEALQDLIERGALRRRDGAWELTDAQVVVPTLVQGALQARLDRLAPRTREVVSVASAVGRGFGLPLLERLLPRDQVAPALSELMRLDLIVEVSRRPAPEYRFRHGLVQEVAYGSLLAPARRTLHRRIGEALVALYGEGAVDGPIARHFAEADEPELAARYLLAAGDAARAVYADHEAVEHYRRAREFLRRLGDPARERETLFKIALVRHLAFDYARAGQAYDAAFDCSAEQPSERAPTPESLVLSLVRSDSYAPGDTYSIESAIVIEQLFRGLLRVDHDLNVVPELAQNMNVSADGLTYLFMLREDACWSDGHPLTAGDFVYAWRALREEGHVTAFLLDDIASAEALDDWTLELHLHEPRNYFPYVLASHWAYPWPRHRIDEVGAAWRRPESLVCNGPFVLTAVDEDGATLSANPHWHAASGNVGTVRIAYRQPEAEHSLEQWNAGDHDLELARVAPPAGPNTIAARSPTLSTAFLAFNAFNGPMADERVRRALAHAIDREALLADWPGVDLAAARGGAIPPVMPGHGDPGVPFDRDAARALLAEAGFAGGEGLPELLISSAPWSPAAALAAQLAEVGVRSRSAPGKHFSIDPQAHAWFAGWHADYPDPDGFYRGLLELDLPLHRDDESDGVLRRARACRDRDERLRLYRAFERLWIGERAALVPLSYSRQLLLRRPYVHGLRLNPMRVLHLEQVDVTPPGERSG